MPWGKTPEQVQIPQASVLVDQLTGLLILSTFFRDKSVSQSLNSKTK